MDGSRFLIASRCNIEPLIGQFGVHLDKNGVKCLRQDRVCLICPCHCADQIGNPQKRSFHSESVVRYGTIVVVTRIRRPSIPAVSFRLIRFCRLSSPQCRVCRCPKLKSELAVKSRNIQVLGPRTLSAAVAVESVTVINR